MTNTNLETNARVTAVLIAIDPGREKCGIAVVCFGVLAAGFQPSEKSARSGLPADFRVLERRIVPRGEFVAHLEIYLGRFEGAFLVLGDATSSQQLRDEISSRWPQLKIETQDESGSTLEARELYWHRNPPRGWRKLWPISLQMPPEPLDDFAALVLARRFLGRMKTGESE